MRGLLLPLLFVPLAALALPAAASPGPCTGTLDVGCSDGFGHCEFWVMVDTPAYQEVCGGLPPGSPVSLAPMAELYDSKALWLCFHTGVCLAGDP